VQVKRQVDSAKSPPAMLDAAVAFLAVVRDLFESFDRTVARTLQERDKGRKLGPGLVSHPTDLVYVGLHDDRAVTKRAAHDEKGPAS
jgi:hypothetical protein